MQTWPLVAGVGLLPAMAIFSLLRRMCSDPLSTEELDGLLEVTQQSYRPLDRLLDPSEFEFLRSSGMHWRRLHEFRRRRRKLFRMYLQRLVYDFQVTEQATCALMATGPNDNPGLARQLARQRLIFYWNLLMVKLRLLMNAAGLDARPNASLLQPLKMLHAELRMLAPSAVAGGL